METPKIPQFNLPLLLACGLSLFAAGCQSQNPEPEPDITVAPISRSKNNNGSAINSGEIAPMATPKPGDIQQRPAGAKTASKSIVSSSTIVTKIDDKIVEKLAGTPVVVAVVKDCKPLLGKKPYNDRTVTDRSINLGSVKNPSWKVVETKLTYTCELSGG